MWPPSYRSRDVPRHRRRTGSRTPTDPRRADARPVLRCSAAALLIAILGLRSFARRQAARAGNGVLLDYLDPAGDLIAGERLGELRMIAPDVALDPSDHLVIGLVPCDEAAFTFDLPGHVLVAAIVEAGPFSYLGSNLGERLEARCRPALAHESSSAAASSSSSTAGGSRRPTAQPARAAAVRLPRAQPRPSCDPRRAGGRTMAICHASSRAVCAHRPGLQATSRPAGTRCSAAAANFG